MTLRTALLGGAAALFLGGSAGLAWAASPALHVLTLQLPGGGTEQIRYSGDVPPHIVLMPQPMPLAVAMAPAGWEPPFAAFDRIAAAMDREAASLMRAADRMTLQAFAPPDALTRAGFAGMPGTGESVLVSFAGNGVCARSVTITSDGSGAAPRVVSHVSGQCGPAAGTATPAVLPEARTPGLPPGVIRVRAETAAPSVRPVYHG